MGIRHHSSIVSCKAQLPLPQGSASSPLMLHTNLSDYLPTVCPLDNKGVIEKVSVVLGATGDYRGRGDPAPLSRPQSCGSADMAHVFRCACVCMSVQCVVCGG